LVLFLISAGIFLVAFLVRITLLPGEGFSGVDIKETDHGFIVMEVNDNPNLEHGLEEQVGKDEIWVRLLKRFVE
jgi:glutathione synthase/RimK-type ligase-like ATP-grasp enzyme